jgi:nanoRNase/pAp phosphatase (c-di-AMP/oligoRNAs hydrolase)
MAGITALTQERVGGFVDRVRRSPGRWVVLTHDNPDPDALAAAALLVRLLRRGFGRRALIAFGGLVGRAENREMVRALNLKLTHVRDLDWSDYRHCALVDTQPRTGNNQFPEDRRPDVVIDHHPLRKATAEAGWADVRTGYGATTTLVAEYLLACGVPLNRRLATALVYALRSETQDFSRGGTGPDRTIYDLYLPHADKRALARILHPRLPPSYFSELRQALANLESVGTLIVSHLGDLEQPDIVPQIADLLLRMEGKTWSLVTGRFGGRLYLSVRTSNPRADAGRLLRKLLARRGGKGGGHGVMAGGWLPLERAPDGDPQALQRVMAARLAAALGKNPERLQPVALDDAAAAAEGVR